MRRFKDFGGIGNLIVFLLIGEALVQFDQRFGPFEDKNQIKVDIKIGAGKELKLLKEKQLPILEGDTRVLVLGDSYTKGAGIPGRENRLPHLIRKQIASRVSNANSYVIDVARPSNEIVDNRNTFFEYVKDFNPDTVVLGITMGDVIGAAKDIKALNDSKQGTDENRGVKETAQPPVKKGRWRVRKVYDVSKLAFYCSRKLQNGLKKNGIALPFGEFHYVTKKAYRADNKDWLAMQTLLTEIIEECRANDRHLIVYKFPNFNLLPHDHFFNQLDNAIGEFFDEHPSVVFMNGKDDFDPQEFEKFIISKNDGHPNGVAHQRIADRILEHIKIRF